MRGTDIAEFYQQLAMLVDAKLPLPESLEKVGRVFPDAKFRAVLKDVSARVDAGESLAAVLERHPHYFDALHVQMIGIGESADVLSHMLFSIAALATFNTAFVTRVQQVTTYPILVLNAALVIFLGMAHYVTPHSAEIAQLFDEWTLYGEEPTPLPLGLRAMIWVSGVTHAVPALVLAVYGVIAFFSLWFLSGMKSSQAALMRVLQRVPGMRGLVSAQDTVLMCKGLSVLLGAGLAVPDALRKVHEMMKSTSVQVALMEVAESVERGGDWAVAVREAGPLDNLIALTIEHSPAETLPDEFDRLSQYFMTRVIGGTRSLLITLHSLLFILTVWTVWEVIRAMLTPMLFGMRGVMY